MNCFHLLKAAERMTFWNEFADGSLVKRSSDQQHDIVNHVAIPAAQPHQPQVALASTMVSDDYAYILSYLCDFHSQCATAYKFPTY